jgi:hypothetical protein
LQEVQTLEELASEGFSGNLKFSVFQIDGLKSPFVTSDFVIDYEITPGDTYKSEEGLTKIVNDSTTVLLKSKEVKIAFTCRLSDEKAASESLEEDAASIRFMTSIMVTDLTDDKEFRQELVARPVAVDLDEPTPNSKIVIHFKALYDKIGSLLNSKNVELEEIEKELKEIGEQMKDSKKKTSNKSGTTAKSSSNKKKKGSTKKSASDSDSTVEEFNDAPFTEGSTLNSVMGFAMMIPEFALQNRALLMAAICCAGVYLYGDYASV